MSLLMLRVRCGEWERKRGREGGIRGMGYGIWWRGRRGGMGMEMGNRKEGMTSNDTCDTGN